MGKKGNNFYDRWLTLGQEAEEEKSKARVAIHENELAWVETPQDARCALLISRDTGFRTWGSVTILGEIPVGHHTGTHSHGEEAIIILSGTGFSVVGGVRYDWEEGSVIAVPFGVRHQHFNSGSSPVRYLSAMSVDLEHYVGIHNTVQYSPWGRTEEEPQSDVSTDGKDSNGRRVVLRREEAVHKAASEDMTDVPSFNDANPLVLGDYEGMARNAHLQHLETLSYMRVGSTLNGFQVREQEISSIMVDPPRQRGGRHAHMEAHIYVLSGSGYSVIDGERVNWSKGSAIHIVGPQTVHQHFNESDENLEMIRIAPGIRYFFEEAAKDALPYLYFEPRGALSEQESSQ